MIWRYGKYKWNWRREMPTQSKFEKWKQEFLSIPESDGYEVWLCGGFLEEWDSWDIDIILFGPYDLDKIQSLLYKGMDIGITKYNMFVDMAYYISPKCYDDWKLFPKTQEIKKITLGHKLTENGKIISYSPQARPITSGLFVRSDIYPKEGQLDRVYKQKPIRLENRIVCH
jgi:hypothetical protein